MRIIAIAILSAFIASCAGSPAPVVAGGPTTLAAVNRSYVKSGYQVVHRNGELLYCRSEAVTGSLFRSTVCHTEAQMQAAEEIRRHAVDEISNAHGGECTILKC